MRRAKILRFISLLMTVALVAVIFVYLIQSEGSSKPIDEVAAQVTGLFENEKSEKSPERMLKKHYGLNAQDYEGVVLYSPISNMDAEEMLIVKLASEDQMNELTEAVQERLDSKTNIYEGYAPEQYDLCTHAVIDPEGNYFLFVVHEDADNIQEAFRKALKN